MPKPIDSVTTMPQLVHFKKEDERLLRQLLAKVKKSADTTDAGAQAASDQQKLVVSLP